MTYSLMLLADPGPSRSDVLLALEGAADIRSDSRLESRFWLQTAHGEAQLNLGTKDPVESIHLECSLEHLPLLEAAARRALELGERLGMRLEDVQWGHEVTLERLPELIAYCRGLQAPSAPETVKPPRRPWWKRW